MAAAVRKKQDDRNLKALRELGALGGNRECFDCGQRGPTYINMTIGSFVCSQCSGVLRGLTPPHRVKSISMATFTQEELDFVRVHGNDECAKTWLGLWNVSDAKRGGGGGGGRGAQDQREHIIDKYEKQRYYLQPASPLKSIGAAVVTTAAAGGLRNGLGSGGGGGGGGSSSAGSSTTNTSSSHPSSPASSVASDNNNNNNTTSHQNQLNLKAIQLTPPTSTRTSGRHHQQNHVLNNNRNNNNIHNHNNGGSNGNAFTEDSLFSEASQQQQQQQVQQQQPWANLNNNTSSLFETAGVGRGQSNGIGASSLSSSPGLRKLNNQQQQGAGAGLVMPNSTATMTARPVAGGQQQQQQGVGGIGGFVADFGSADIIFNANVISGHHHHQQNGFGGGGTSNGLVKGAPGGAGSADKINGNVQNGAFGAARKQEENFADFDHNPIFNSAEYNTQQQQQQQKMKFQTQQNTATIPCGGGFADGNCNYANISSAGYSYFNNPPLRSYTSNNAIVEESPRVSASGLGDDGQNNNSTIPFNCNAPANVGQPSGGFWYPQQQQQPWPSSLDQQCSYSNNTSNIAQMNQNRWSAVPMSMSSSNSSMASTPSADRYAALKDLDEQIREFKVKEVQQQQQQPVAFSNPNPFKAAPTNPFTAESNLFTAAQQQLQHQPPAHTTFNGFHSSANGFGSSNIFGQQMGVNATGIGMPNKSNNPFLCQF